MPDSSTNDTPNQTIALALVLGIGIPFLVSVTIIAVLAIKLRRRKAASIASRNDSNSQDASRKMTIVSDILPKDFAVGGDSDQVSIITVPLGTKTRGPPTIMSEHPQITDLTRFNSLAKPPKERMTVPMSKYSPAFNNHEWV